MYLVVKACGVVVLDDPEAVGAVGVFEIENLRVVLRLLQAVSSEAVLRLRLDNREWSVAQVRKEIVNPLPLAATDGSACDDDSSRREAHLLANLIVRPTRRVESGQNVGPARVGLSRHCYRSQMASPCVSGSPPAGDAGVFLVRCLPWRSL